MPEPTISEQLASLLAPVKEALEGFAAPPAGKHKATDAATAEAIDVLFTEATAADLEQADTWEPAHVVVNEVKYVSVPDLLKALNEVVSEQSTFKDTQEFLMSKVLFGEDWSEGYFAGVEDYGLGLIENLNSLDEPPVATF